MFLNYLAEGNKKLFIDMEISLAKADGIFSDVERAIVGSHCDEMGLTISSYDVDEAYEHIVDKLKENFTTKEKKIALMELFSVALIDNNFAPEEKEFIEKTRELFDLSMDDVKYAEKLVSQIISVYQEMQDYLLKD